MVQAKGHSTIIDLNRTIVEIREKAKAGQPCVSRVPFGYFVSLSPSRDRKTTNHAEPSLSLPARVSHLPGVRVWLPLQTFLPLPIQSTSTREDPRFLIFREQ